MAREARSRLAMGIAAGATGLLLFGATSERAAAQQSPPNLGLAVRVPNLGELPLLAQGGIAVFSVDEASQGADLDGDGESTGQVLHVFDATSGRTVNTGLRGLVPGSALISVDEAGVVFVVRESDTGVDLNADGDQADAVPQVLRRGADRVSNVGLALSPAQPLLVDGGHLAFAVDEEAEDLNGDGDRDDRVLHSFEISSGRVTNHRRAVSAVALQGSVLASVVAEIEQGRTDLNGDGDAIDRVAELTDLATGETTPLGLAVGDRFALIGGRLFLSVAETAQGRADLNDDGDTQDSVLHVFDPALGQSANLGRIPMPGSPLVGSGDQVAFVVDEADAQEDLNGDADQLDAVAFAFDAAAGVMTNLGKAVRGGMILGVTPNLIALGVAEGAEGAEGTDLNADGDALDSVLHVFDPRTRTSANLALALGQWPELSVAGPLVAVRVRERDQGADLDENGQIDDRLVLHVFDVSQGRTRNLGVAGEGLALGDERVAFSVSELDSGDLNGDGDLLDRVVQVFSPSSGELQSLPASDLPPLVSDPIIAVAIRESSERRTDLNRDGDALDSVLVLFDLASGRSLNSERAVSRAALTSELALFAVPERSQGTDLNGDGDMADQVLHVLELPRRR